tara:strand:- start:701 stop:1387 length:687 start_codon:yes stop_codon:yes gene_type:complete
MKIDTALILCAGFGKRLYPITLDTPKPLLKLKDVTLIENCIELIIKLNIKKILINTFYLKEKIYEFFKNHNYKIDIQVVDDGNTILDTGGGILNLLNQSNEKDFLIFNPDTIWSQIHVEEIKMMIDFYFSKKIKNLLLLVNKNLSFDQDMKGDFGLHNQIIHKKIKSHIFTGCQILNRSVLDKEILSSFSISKIWFDLIKNKQLYGFESKIKFYHATNLEIFKKLQDL